MPRELELEIKLCNETWLRNGIHIPLTRHVSTALDMLLILFGNSIQPWEIIHSKEQFICAYMLSNQIGTLSHADVRNYPLIIL
jgi:hypothetical protein